MALIKCKECNKEISETARKCPNCGAITEKTKAINKVLLKLISLIGIFLVIILVCHQITIHRSSYKLGKEAIDVLNSYKNNYISQKEAYNQLDVLYDKVKQERDKLENTSSNEYFRLFSIGSSILGILIDFASPKGASMFDINESINEIKSDMKFFSP